MTRPATPGPCDTRGAVSTPRELTMVTYNALEMNLAGSAVPPRACLVPVSSSVMDVVDDLSLDLDAVIVVKGLPMKASTPAVSEPTPAPEAANSDSVCVPGTRLVLDWCPPPRVRGGKRRAVDDDSSDSSEGEGGFPANVRTVHKDIAFIKEQFPSTCEWCGVAVDGGIPSVSPASVDGACNPPRGGGTALAERIFQASCTRRWRCLIAAVGTLHDAFSCK